ncbi:hypothetical protein [Streptomyces sp. CA-146814]|uniref:hypothetical protein n=1 Tax=Streptomyces sp. CA-146814 TaxID=3240053 RepID=UPI003D948B5E
MRRRIFLHFADHEILARMAAGSIPPLITCERLVRISAVVSPEPALFPISAHHEEIAISKLLQEFSPLIQNDLLRVTGSGANPSVNLYSRRRQFDSDKKLFAPLFASAQNRLVEEYSAGWVEKQGNTTFGIRKWWATSVVDPESQLSLTLYAGRPVPDHRLDALLDLPDQLGNRPILADLIADAISLRGLAEGATAHLRGDLGAHLTRQWASLYCDSLSATVFRDFGRGVPEMSVFTPTHFPTLSARRIELMLTELGIHQPLFELPIPVLAAVLYDLRVEREYLANDLFAQGISRSNSWTERHLTGLARYQKRRQRSLFWTGPSHYSSRTHSSATIRKSAHSLARSLECYADVARNHHSGLPEREYIVDRSFHVSHVTGDVNVAQDSATINTVKISSSGVANHLLRAMKSESDAARFVEWISGTDVTLAEGVTADTIVADFDFEQMSSENKSLLRRISENLALSATSSGTVIAVIEAIKGLTS